MIINLTEDLWNNANNSGGHTIELFGYKLEADVKRDDVKFFEVYEPGQSDYKRMELGEYLMFTDENFND